jgi:hypothetical protein
MDNSSKNLELMKAGATLIYGPMKYKYLDTTHYQYSSTGINWYSSPYTSRDRWDECTVDLTEVTLNEIQEFIDE